MTLIAIPPNIAPGGQILSTDETTVYNVINGGLDSTNISPGSLSGTSFAAGSISATKLKQTTTNVGVQQPAAKHFGGVYIALPFTTMFLPGLFTDAGVGTIGSIGGWRLAGSTGGTAGPGVIGGGAGTLTVSTNAIGDNSTDFNMAGGIGSGGADGSVGGGWARVAANTTPQFIVWLAVVNNANVATNQAFLTSNYLQASPPYDLGDGEIPLFVYALMGKDGHVASTYVSQDPPWLSHPVAKLNTPVTHEEALADPTKMEQYLSAIDAHLANRVGLKNITDRWLKEPDTATKAALAKSIKELGSSLWQPTPDTQEHKNRNMGKTPHPFTANDLVKGGAFETSAPLTPVLLDPMDKNTQRLALLHESGENVNALLHNKHVMIGNTHIAGRKGPPGVMIVSHSFKNSGGR